MLILHKHVLLFKHSFRLIICLLMLQVSSSVLSSSGEGTGSGSALKYPGQDGLYTSVGLSQPSDVSSVRGEAWCPMALAWTSKSLKGQRFPGPSVWMLCSVEVFGADVCFLPHSWCKKKVNLQSHCKLESSVEYLGFRLAWGILLP